MTPVFMLMVFAALLLGWSRLPLLWQALTGLILLVALATFLDTVFVQTLNPVRGGAAFDTVRLPRIVAVNALTALLAFGIGRGVRTLRSRGRLDH